jgi:hypothetical protein
MLACYAPPALAAKSLCYRHEYGMFHLSGLRCNAERRHGTPLCRHGRTRMKRTIVAATIASLLVGCAASPGQFYADRRGISASQLCGAMFSTYAKNNYSYYRDINEEASRRGLASSDCEEMNRQTNQSVATAALLGLVIVAATKGGGDYTQSSDLIDAEWDWDQFRNQQGDLVWACRGVQTGKFSEDNRCARKLKTDFRWPQK